MSMLWSLKGKVSAEPVVFFYFLTMVFSYCLSTNLLVYKACDPTAVTAVRVGTKCADEKAAQHVVTPINGWKGLVQQLVPIALAMAAGTWSDRHGCRRRPLIAVPVAGQILADAMTLYCVVWWSISPAVTAAVQAAALSLSGGLPMLFTGVNSYVADITSEEWRTVRYGTVSGAITIGSITGMFVYATAMTNGSFVSAYLLSIGLGLVTMAMTYIFIKGPSVDSFEEVPMSEQSLYRDIIRAVNPVTVFRSCYKILFKRRPGHNTVILCLAVLICAPLTCVPLEGESSILYLFLRYKFKWTEKDFSIFNIYFMSIVFIGTVFALGILSHKLKMNDALIGMIASVFDLLAAIAFVVVSQSWQLYLVPPLELFRGATLALTSSITSKSVDSTELGAMNSVKLLIESSTKGAFIPLYNFVYNRTFESMPSAFFLISVVLTVPLILVFGLIYYFSRNQISSKHDTTISSINNK